MISKVEIRNFRCLKDLKIDRITPITILTGKNSAGKSSVLEALYVAKGYHDARWILDLNGYRQSVIYPPYTLLKIWLPFFYNLDSENLIQISLTKNSKTEKIELSKIDNYLAKFDYNQNIPIMDTNMYAPRSYYEQKKYHALKFVKSIHEIPKEEIYYFLVPPNAISMEIVKPKDAHKEIAPDIDYINSRAIGNPAELFSMLDLKNQTDRVIDFMKIIDPRIQELSTIMIDGVVTLYADIGLPNKIPVQSLGDGFNKLIYIILAVLGNEDELILIDEIDNGFHYSILPKIWETLAFIAKKVNCQIMATTHSYECLKSAVEGVKKANRFEDMSIIRLENKDGQSKAFPFSSDMIEVSLENELEMR